MVQVERHRRCSVQAPQISIAVACQLSASPMGIWRGHIMFSAMKYRWQAAGARLSPRAARRPHAGRPRRRRQNRPAASGRSAFVSRARRRSPARGVNRTRFWRRPCVHQGNCHDNQNGQWHPEPDVNSGGRPVRTRRVCYGSSLRNVIEIARREVSHPVAKGRG
jgi:hypothetical protein